MLYGAAWRAARAIGYQRLVTYTLAAENGASLRAAGWRVVAEVKRSSPDVLTRPRQRTGDRALKQRWEAPADVTAAADRRDAQNVRQRCEVCGAVVALIGVRGKRRDARTCSDRCRQRAHRRRQRALAGQQAQRSTDPRG
jgi:hypothetical protein